MIRIALLAVAALGATAAQAQVFKCLDPNGKVFYSQNPCPPNMKREAMAPRGIPPAPVAAPAEPGADKAAKSGAPKTAADQEQAYRKRQQDQAKAAKDTDQKNADAQAKEQNCRAARQRLAQFEIGGRISQINEKGERYYMEDSQIEAGKAQARAEVSQYCN